jgi:hypothetical protein
VQAYVSITQICYYLKTFLSVEDADNSALDLEGLLTVSTGPAEEVDSGRMGSDSLSS